MTGFDISAAARRTHPFPCFTVASVLSTSCEALLLDWLETEAPWRISRQDFYEQYEFDFRDIAIPEGLAPFFSDAAAKDLRDKVASLFGVTLGPQIDITAHRLNRSQKIQIHNDARPDGETHRFLVQLNRAWPQENGGMLMLFSGPEVESLVDILPPTSRSAFGFKISQASFHAVSQVHQGDRFTLVFSFYELKS